MAVAVNPMFKGPELEHELNDAGAETSSALTSSTRKWKR